MSQHAPTSFSASLAHVGQTGPGLKGPPCPQPFSHVPDEATLRPLVPACRAIRFQRIALDEAPLRPGRRAPIRITVVGYPLSVIVVSNTLTTRHSSLATASRRKQPSSCQGLLPSPASSTGETSCRQTTAPRFSRRSSNAQAPNPNEGPSPNPQRPRGPRLEFEPLDFICYLSVDLCHSSSSYSHSYSRCLSGVKRRRAPAERARLRSFHSLRWWRSPFFLFLSSTHAHRARNMRAFCLARAPYTKPKGRAHTSPGAPEARALHERPGAENTRTRTAH